ncbi:hypothetical protein G7K_1745-t1 [Saitoella complicata NRRL Y-17804]|uniref:Uncharacterized protein n=1 Tax=Saitoella complicata (strain BCRC 22490 / CBS 7301 / JCM 7358 / NBRC 10748 / NRRL Y-17804) TaxID=698492 RepID=A0A0E9NDQ9_SAICN|nr:hypothetical protein G7K_1745-t1 [Saitoella complicata NRRL Y-17804]
MSLGKNIKRLSFFGKDKDIPSTPLPFSPGIPQTPGVPSSADNDQPLSTAELHALISALESLLTNFDILRDLSLRLARATKTQASSIEAYSKVLNNIPAGARNEGTNTVIAVMSASAAYLEEIGHVQSKFAKHMAKEYDALNTYAASHFRTLAKSESRTTQTHLKLSRLAASQSGASPPLPRPNQRTSH